MTTRIQKFAKLFAVPLFLLAMTSCSLVEGRESASQYADDASITASVKASYVADPVVKAMQVNVETMKGTVQLSGFADSAKAKQRAVQLARETKGVQSVQDDIVVRPRHK